MDTIRLGKSSLCIGRVGSGTMGLGGYFTRDESRDGAMIQVLQQAIEGGANLIDTAEIYGDGHAEELVGKAISGRRSQVVVATKFSPEHSTSQAVIQAAERSLSRLRTDVIDLFQTHWPNPRVPFDQTLEGLQTLLARGWVRCVGLSNASLRQTRACQHAFAPGQFVSLQQQYNLADRYVEQTHLTFCRDNSCALLAYSPLLEGKLAPVDERQSELGRLAEQLNLTLGQLILAWLLRHPEVVVIPKAGTPKHVSANIAAAQVRLPPEIITRVDELYSQQVLFLEPRAITIEDTPNRHVYRNLEQALANPARMSPSPAEFAEDIRTGEPFKPVKVRRAAETQYGYHLAEGRLRYWAWVIAFGDEKPLPCFPV
jgi:aryl-alcohol dehydrogenase-like predicted oxidoreductase